MTKWAGSYSFKNHKTMETDLPNGVALRIEPYTPNIARLFFLDRTTAQEVLLPAGLTVHRINQHGGETQVLPTANREFYLHYTQDYIVRLNNQLLFRTYTQRQMAIRAPRGRRFAQFKLTIEKFVLD